MTRLSTTKLAAWRTQRLADNGGKCGLCLLPARRPCADHDHATGQLRDVICGGCNSVLGKVENNYQRYGVQNLAAFLHGAARYLQKHATPQHGLLYPTHRTDEEKAEAAKKRRAAARKAKKEST